MATTLTIVSGATTATVTATNDTKAAEVLRLFAKSLGALDGESAQVKANLVVAALRAYMVKEAQEQAIRDARNVERATAAESADF
jgi:hypothetical protein